MDKLDMQSKNLVDDNIEMIAKLFPNCITEGMNEDGQVVKLVDFDLLKQELSKDIVEGNDERYTLNWAGKKQAILTANSPINATLRPCRKESVDADGTKGDDPKSKFDSQNLYIEGDNLDVLKLLRETYLGKVKMIYIDPPYNTGNDFIYEDDFAESVAEYLDKSSQFDLDGNKLFQNTETNGRFHSDWLSMMYMRLKIARDLLSNDGVIFISIDDNELTNLQKLCDEIFGSVNYVGIAPRKTRGSATTQGDNELQKLNDYMLIYFKNKYESSFNKKLIGQKTYPYSDERGDFYIVPMQDNGPNGTREARPNLWYPIFQLEDGTLTYEESEKYIKKFVPSQHHNKDGCWMWSKPKFDKDKKDLIIHNDKVYIKHYFNPEEDQNKYQRERMWLEDFQNAKGTVAVNSLFEVKGLFSNPKPLELLEYCLKIGSEKDSLIVDFFSGSATTAHAVMQLNAEDGGNRKFIMVQLPELCDEKSEAYKAGYNNICEIGKERIRRAGKKIKELDSMNGDIVLHRLLNKDKITEKDREEFKKTKEYEEFCNNLDTGFRVLKLDSSCMKDVYYSPAEMSQDLLARFEDNIKEDRTAEDLLFQVMLDMGVVLSSEIKTVIINGKKVFNVNNGNLVCCFEKDINEAIVTEIAKMEPLYAAFRDSSMSTDSVAVNFDQIFETYSPTTTRKVL